MVISGSNRGTSYALQEGETSIGRQQDCTIVLSSSKVSKRHCVFLMSNNGEITLRDEGSTNGTFVNGVLSKLRKLKSGDRVSVGDFVLELKKAIQRTAEQAPPAQDFGNVIQFSQPEQMPAFPQMPPHQASAGASEVPIGDPMPTDLKGKALWYLERLVMPFFYGMNLKSDWKAMVSGLVGVLVIGSLVLSVYPLLEANRKSLLKELARRAQVLARDIVDRNSAALAAKAETKTEIGSAGNEDGVDLALLTDLDNRILAPSNQLNQYLASGAEAGVALKAAKLFRQGTERGLVEHSDGLITAVEPVSVFDPRQAKNVVVAMAIVSIDSSLSLPDFGTMSKVYAETLIVTGILALLIGIILVRLTLKPFEVLNEDIDKVLKGDLGEVTHEFKNEGLDALWNVVNSALQRIPKGSDGGISLGSSIIDPQQFIGPIRMVGDAFNCGIVLCDEERKIVFLSPVFEEITGIRGSDSIGQELASAARDVAFGSLVKDMFGEVQGGGSATEDFDFSGVAYKMVASSFGTSTAKAYVLAAIKTEEG